MYIYRDTIETRILSLGMRPAHICIENRKWTQNGLLHATDKNGTFYEFPFKTLNIDMQKEDF